MPYKVMKDLMPVGTMECGCLMFSYEDNAHFDIEYCPQHNAAPDLLAACEALRDYIVNEVFASGGETVPQVKQADAAIAKTREGE